MFSAFKGYFLAIGAALISGLFIVIKVLTLQKKVLKQKVARGEKLEEITNKVDKAKQHAEKKEDEAIKDIDNDNWRDSI